MGFESISKDAKPAGGPKNDSRRRFLRKMVEDRFPEYWSRFHVENDDVDHVDGEIG